MGARPKKILTQQTFIGKNKKTRDLARPVRVVYLGMRRGRRSDVIVDSHAPRGNSLIFIKG